MTCSNSSLSSLVENGCILNISLSCNLNIFISSIFWKYRDLNSLVLLKIKTNFKLPHFFRTFKCCNSRNLLFLSVQNCQICRRFNSTKVLLQKLVKLNPAKMKSVQACNIIMINGILIKEIIMSDLTRITSHVFLICILKTAVVVRIMTKSQMVTRLLLPIATLCQNYPSHDSPAIWFDQEMVTTTTALYFMCILNAMKQ